MKIIRSLSALRESLNKLENISLIPTMGNLHKGHLSLITEAQKLSKNIVLTIFINPIQFDSKYDLENYPKTLKQDIDLLKDIGVAILFTPSAKDIFPVKPNISYKMPNISNSNPNKFISFQFMTKLFYNGTSYDVYYVFLKHMHQHKKMKRCMPPLQPSDVMHFQIECADRYVHTYIHLFVAKSHFLIFFQSFAIYIFFIFSCFSKIHF